jgi:drug/metabolite transporter (DMT)-like permease
VAAAELTTLLLVAFAAVAHASWNFLAKRASGGTDFVAACIVMNVVLCAPPAISLLVISPEAFLAAGPVIVLGSGLLHSAYWLALNRGYSKGALSVVYPIARGSGAALAAAIAILLFDEQFSPIALTGAIVIVVAILALAIPHTATDRAGPTGHGWALLTGALIAAYTLWDSRAVGTYELSPIVYYWLVNVANAAILAPRLVQHGALYTLKRHLGPASAVGLLSTLSYVPVLYALAIAPVNIVAPAREISVLLGAAMGIELLGESERRLRMFTACAMVLGIIAIAIG